MLESAKQAARWVESFIAELMPREKALAEAWWRANTSGKKEDEAEAARREEEYRLLFADPIRFGELKALEAGFKSDPSGVEEHKLLARQLLLLKNEFGMNRMEPAALRELVSRIVEVESRFNNFRALLGGQHVTDNRLKEILRPSVVEEEDSLTESPQWGSPKFIAGCGALRDVIFEPIAHVMHEQIGKQIRCFAAQRSRRRRPGSH